MEDPDPTLPPPRPAVPAEAGLSYAIVAFLPFGLAGTGGAPGSSLGTWTAALLLVAAAAASLPLGRTSAGRWACVAGGIGAVSAGHLWRAWNGLSPGVFGLASGAWYALWIAGTLRRAGKAVPPTSP